CPEGGSPASIHNGRDRSPMEAELVAQAFTAALITALAMGLGALPVVLLHHRTENVLVVA
ncbi:MAG: hypothetical protein V3U10_00840, partial [Bacteroidota bacterium]